MKNPPSAADIPHSQKSPALRSTIADKTLLHLGSLQPASMGRVVVLPKDLFWDGSSCKPRHSVEDSHSMCTGEHLVRKIPRSRPSWGSQPKPCLTLLNGTGLDSYSEMSNQKMHQQSGSLFNVFTYLGNLGAEGSIPHQLTLYPHG